MTSSTTPGYPGSSDTSLGNPAAEPTAPGVREEASNLASEAGDAGRRVAGVAKGEAKSVGYEARRQARRLADQVGSEVRQQAATQQSRAASGLRNIGDEFSNMADGSGSGSGFAADLARQAGERVGGVAQWLDERDPRSILEEVKGFARRRPGVFIAIAVGAGIVVGRLTRALAQPSDDADESRSITAPGARTGSAYASTGTGTGPIGGTATGTPSTTGVPTMTDTQTVVTGAAGDSRSDEPWTEASPTGSRGGV